MISITGQVRRLFEFPAKPEAAFSFFLNFTRVIEALPKIEFVTWHHHQEYANACRVRYHATEMGLYSVTIYCDLYTESEPNDLILHVKPFLQGIRPEESNVSWYSLKGSGTFSSISTFTPHQDFTKIDYSLSLQAELPVPLGLRLVPGSVLEGIASRIVNRRIQEIADGFIRRSTQSYRSLILNS